MRAIQMIALALSSLVTFASADPDETAEPMKPLIASDERTYVWISDPAHSSIVFRTGHWGVVDVVGWFETYEIHVRGSALDFSDAVVEARLEPASVRMPNPDMAGNLRQHFFEVEKFPEVRFRSTKVEPTSEASVFTLTGALTMKEVTRPVVFTMRFNGYGTPPQGAPGFTLEAALDRLEFGVGGMERMMGTGHPMVDADVEVICNIRLDYVRTEFAR